MKTLAILAVLVVGGIQLGCHVYDGAVKAAQQTTTAQLIKERQAL